MLHGRGGIVNYFIAFCGRAPIWETVPRVVARLGFPTRAGFACGGVGGGRWPATGTEEGGFCKHLGHVRSSKLPGYQSNLPWWDAKVNRPVFLYFPVHSSESREV